jgi:hypothetical protein
MPPGGRITRPHRPVADLTQQSTSKRGVGGWNGQGMAWRHCFWKGILVG